MNSVSLLSNVRSLVLAFAMAAGIFASPALAAEDIGQSVASIPVPAGLSSADVQEAIVMTLAGRQWGIKSREADRVVGYLKHRSNEATVTLIYSTTQVELFCVGWQIDKRTGARQKPEQPRGWLKNIQVDLTKNLNRAVTQKS